MTISRSEGQTATENDTTHPPQAVSQRRSLQMRKQKNAILPDKSPPKSTKKHLRLHDGAVSDSSPLAGPSAVGVRSKLVATAPIPDARETREVVIESGSTTAVPVMPKREPLREKLKTWNSIAPGDLNELTQKSSFKDESGPEEQVSEVEIDDNNVESTGPQFYVQYLLGARYHKSMNRVEWKVKWAGYPETEATWEPIKMLYGNGKEVGRENRLLMKFFKAKYGTPDEKRLCIMEKATFSEAKRWETQKIPS